MNESNDFDVAKPIDLDDAKPVDNEFNDDDDDDDGDDVDDEAANNEGDTKFDVFWTIASDDFEVIKTDDDDDDDDDDEIIELDIREVNDVEDVEGIRLDVNNAVELSDEEIENVNGDTKIELAVAIDELDILALIVLASKRIVFITARTDRTIKKYEITHISGNRTK